MEIIKNQALFPDKHKVDVAFLITKFFTATDKVDIQFIPAFTKARDSQGQRHWIISAFKNLQQKQYSKASRYTASSCTDLAGARF